MSKTHSSTNNAAAVAISAEARVGSNVKTWSTVFVFASLTLMALQPTAIVATTVAVALMLTMTMISYSSVAETDGGAAFDARQKLISLIAPAQLACFIWVAVNLGRMMVGTALVTSSLAALAALAIIVIIDAALSAAVLLTAERGQGVSGISTAALISSKYIGLLGKIA